jgi:hypothetical protein
LLPNGIFILDGTTGRLVAFSADVTGDGRADILLFDPVTGNLKTVFSGTGEVIAIAS